MEWLSAWLFAKQLTWEKKSGSCRCLVKLIFCVLCKVRVRKGIVRLSCSSHSSTCTVPYLEFHGKGTICPDKKTEMLLIQRWEVEIACDQNKVCNLVTMRRRCRGAESTSASPDSTVLCLGDRQGRKARGLIPPVRGPPGEWGHQEKRFPQSPHSRSHQLEGRGGVSPMPDCTDMEVPAACPEVSSAPLIQEAPFTYDVTPWNLNHNVWNTDVYNKERDSGPIL